MTFLTNFVTALIKPKKYSQILDSKKSFVAAYVLIILAISLLSYVLGFISIYKNIGIYYKEVIPDFKFENSTLTVSEPFRFELVGQIIYADSEKEMTTNDFGENSQGFLFDSDSFIMRHMGQDIEVKYSQLTEEKSVTFSKQDTYLLAPKLTMYYMLFCTLMFLILVGGFFLGALFVALISKLPNMAVGLSFGKLYKLALFSRGLPLVLSLVTSLFFTGIPFVVSFLISCIIMNIALGAMAKNKII